MARGENFNAAVGMVIEQCCNCGIAFAMTVEFKNDRLQRRRGDCTFYCPRGHAQHYTGESETTLLLRERDQLKQREAYLEDQRRAAQRRADHAAAVARGHKGHAAKLTKRIRAGTCPCCKRTFENLQRHMATQHPKFGAGRCWLCNRDLDDPSACPAEDGVCAECVEDSSVDQAASQA